MLDSFVDSLIIRNSTSYDGSPARTTGSIVFGALLRMCLVIIAGFYMWNNTLPETAATITVVLLWGYVIYPAYRQYVVFHDEVSNIRRDTLCGSCKHFDLSSQRCAVYDEHISEHVVPCEGMDWEPL